METGDLIHFDTNRGRKSGFLIKENFHTVIVKIKRDFIKRHKLKHNIET